ITMKVVVAIDSFKGSCTTFEAADAIERGIRYYSEDVDVVKLPIADGGEGTVDSLVETLNGQYIEANVLNPIGKNVKAKYGILPNKVAVIEASAASGLTLLSEKELNPLI